MRGSTLHYCKRFGSIFRSPGVNSTMYAERSKYGSGNVPFDRMRDFHACFTARFRQNHPSPKREGDNVLIGQPDLGTVRVTVDTLINRSELGIGRDDSQTSLFSRIMYIMGNMRWFIHRILPDLPRRVPNPRHRRNTLRRMSRPDSGAVGRSGSNTAAV